MFYRSITEQHSVGIFGSILIVFLLHGLFVAEIIRKYITDSVVTISIYEISIVLLALVCAIRNTLILQKTAHLICTAIVIIAWAAYQTLLLANFHPTFFLGLRTIVYPLAMAVIAVYIIDIIGLRDYAFILFKAVLFWITIISIIAVLQVIAGPSTYITLGVSVTSDLFWSGGGMVYGLGNWSDSNVMFRTSAIFEHTGKYGQLITMLCLISAFLRYHLDLRLGASICILAIELFAVYFSGQRAGLIAYLIIIIVFNPFRWRTLFLLMLVPLFMLTILGSLGVNILGRLPTLTADIANRLEESAIIPFVGAMQEYFFLGIGFGYLSFGSQTLGGTALIHILPNGIPENSYARIIVETSFLGLIFHLVHYMLPMITAFVFIIKRVLCERNWEAQSTQIALFIVFVTTIVCIWSLFHDLLGATATMGLFFIIIAMNTKMKSF